mmetsp:Transcript_9351/g.13981  ORF Transcript_9351/g.13981 Transcript_9351/m.13981 type:complete len:210 (-) Transcript_9351:597-1226(-)
MESIFQLMAPPDFGFKLVRKDTRAISSPAPPSAPPKLRDSAAIPPITMIVYRSTLDLVNGLRPLISSERFGSKKLVPAFTVVRLPPNLGSFNAAHVLRTNPSTGHPNKYAHKKCPASCLNTFLLKSGIIIRFAVSNTAPLTVNLSKNSKNKVKKKRKFKSIPVAKLNTPSSTDNTTPAINNVLVGLGVKLVMLKFVICSNKIGVTVLLP